MKDVKLALVTVNCSMWAGRKQIKDVEYTGKLKEGEKLPPATIATIGSKSIFPKAKISDVAKPKAKAMIWLRENGIMLNATSAVIPYDKAEEFKNLMSELQKEFGQKVNKLISEYDDSLKNYAASYPEWSNFILGSAMSKEKIAGKYSFKHRVQPYTTFDDSDMALHEELVQDFLEQISDDMMVYFDSLLKSEKITVRGVEKIQMLIDKIRSFSFLSPKMIPLVVFMEGKLKEAQAIQDLKDPNKPISGEAKRIIEKMVVVMSNTKKLQLMVDELLVDVSYDAFGNLIDDSVKDVFSEADKLMAKKAELKETSEKPVKKSKEPETMQLDFGDNTPDETAINVPVEDEEPVFSFGTSIIEDEEIDYNQFQQ
jgi:hypothetical protein